MHYITNPIAVTLLDCCHGAERQIALPPDGRLIALTIPPGIGHGQSISIALHGNSYSVPVQVSPDQVYQREGNDLQCEIPLSPEERRDGTTRQIQTPWGPVDLEVPKNCPEETRYRVNGYGVPIINGAGQRGDLHAVIKHLKPEQSALGKFAGSLVSILFLAIMAAGALAYVVFGLNIDFPGSRNIRDEAHQATERIKDLAEGKQEASESKAVPPNLRHQELKQLMLDLTNEERVKAGSPPVVLGNNTAAQLHAEAALDGCYSSHWDRWGLKPHMRHTLTGGGGANGENVTGLDYCIKWTDGYAGNAGMQEEVSDAVHGWMDSPGHRRTLLDPAYTRLNAGIAYDSHNTVMVQHFDTDYATFNQIPHVNPAGVLAMSGDVSRATLNIGNAANVQIVYDPPSKPLTRGQLSRTYSLCNGSPVAYVVAPLTGRQHYIGQDLKIRTDETSCTDPYSLPEDLPAPRSVDEAHEFWADAKARPETVTKYTTRRIIANRMNLTNTEFQFTADISTVLADYGPGIYTVILWGRPLHLDSAEPNAEYSIFWRTQPTEGNPYESR